MSAWRKAPIAQRIECGPPEAEAQVRVLLGALTANREITG
jgi:hypothetical protein